MEEVWSVPPGFGQYHENVEFVKLMCCDINVNGKECWRRGEVWWDTSHSWH